jgi:hypothetical protein
LSSRFFAGFPRKSSDGGPMEEESIWKTGTAERRRNSKFKIRNLESGETAEPRPKSKVDPTAPIRGDP